MNFAIIGASGNVGRKTIEILEKSKFHFKSYFWLLQKKVPEIKLNLEKKKS